MIIENLSHARCQNGAGRALRAVASVALAAASLVAPAAAYGAVPESKNGENITFSIPTSLRCAVRADGTVIAPSGWSMSNSGSGKVEITGVSVSNAIGKLKLSGKSGTIGYAVGNGNGSYSVSYDAASDCKFSSTSNRPLGIESGKSLSWNWNIGKLNASDHRAALDAAASGRARLCDMSFSYAPVGNSLSSEGTTGSMSGTVNSQSSSVMPVGGTATANVGNAPSNASLSYQWYTVDSNGSYSAIANANGKTLKVLAAYRGKDIVCRVSDSSGHYSGYVETARKPVRNLTPKVGISGSSVYGNKLTATVSGLPSGATYTYKYKWQRLFGSSWTDIANATAAEYTLGGEDVGKQVRVIVSTASNIYTVDDVTAVSATVAKAKASIGVSISGTKNNSSRLTASVNGLPAAGTNTVSYRWQRSSDGKSNWVDSTASDAKSNSIQMQPNDVSWHYRCIVSASNPYYDIASSTSAAYGPIAKSTVSAARATISGNAVYGGTIKANVTNVPTVGTNSISYQWQYSEDGKAWNDTRLDGGKTSSLVLSAVSCVGTQYRCVISVDNSYYIVPGCSTGGIKVGKASAQVVAKASGEAVAGKALTVAVSGLPTVGGTNKIYYQWQFSNDGKTWSGSTLDGATTSTLHLYDSDNVAHSMVGFSYRCIVSVSGNSAYDIKSATSNVIGPVVKGTAAAPSVSVGGTKKIESTLKATVTSLPKYGNSNVSYQWQTSADGSTWADSTQSDAKSVSFKPAYSLVGKYVRCAVSVSNDQYNVATGYSAAFGKLGKASKTISAAIISPNKRNGDTLTCGISGLASNGANTVAYKWEMTLDSAFKTDVRLSEDKGNTHITAWGTNTYYRCTVTASNPYYEYNTAVSPIYGPLAKGVASAPTVTVSGSNAWGSTLKATVTGLPKYGNTKVSYQWEARDDSSTTWGNSGYATATTDHITIDAQDAVSKARHYRCKVTVDNDQYTVPVAYSADHGKTVKALATSKVAISGTSAVGGKLTCSVSGLPTSGSNTVSYQWQYSNDNRTWTNSTYTDAKTSSHSLGYKDAYNLYWRCAVSVSNPYYSVPTAYTDSRLCGKGTASITASISGNAVIGGKLTCSIGGLPSIGTNSVKYKWQYSSDGKAWTDSTNATASSNSITLPPDATLGKYFRCVVSATNAMYNDMSATSAASAKVGKGSHSAPSVSISGAKVYGSTLTASVSGQPTGTTGTSYQWQRADAANGTYANIANATGKTYSVGTVDMNKYLRVLVNTANTYYNVSQGISAGYGAIGKATTSISATASGNKVIESAITANVTGLPSVGTNTVSYQWQYSNDNKAWTSSTQGDAKTKTFTPNYTLAGVYVRCIISVSGNAYYNINGYTLNVGQIGKGTKTVSVSLTGNAAVGGSLKANVSGLPSNGTNTIAYQWQSSSDNKTWTNSTAGDAKMATHALNYKEAYNVYWRCTVSVSGNQYYNVNGATSASKLCVKGTASITASVSGSAVIGGKLTCSVGGLPSIGTNSVSYKWQYSADGGTWTDSSNSGAKTNVVSLPPDGTLGKRYRCVVTATNSVYNNMSATSAASAAIGKGTATASVTVSGSKVYGATLTANPSQPTGTTGTSYQWQRNTGTNGAWVNISNATGKTYVAGTADVGHSVRVLMNTANTYYNVSQCASAAAAIGKATTTATATVSGTKAVGSKLTVSVGGLPSVGTNTITYKWQCSSDNKTWTDSNSAGASSNALTTDTTWLNKYARCVITVSGNAYYNVNGATSAAYGPIGKGSHAAPSVSISGAKTYGSTLTANVSGQPTGTTGTTYQWQRADATNGTYANISNATGRTYSVGTADMNKYLRVLVNTANTYYNVSQGVSAGYGSIGKATSSPSVRLGGTALTGGTLTCTISGLPAVGTNNIAYQWQYSKDGSTDWTNSSYSDAKTNSLKLQGADLGWHYRCSVSFSGNAYYDIKGAVTAASAVIGKGTAAAPKVTISGGKSYGSSMTANVSGQPSGTTSTSYQWQYSSDGGKTWANSSWSGSTTNKISAFGGDFEGKYFRCVVTTASSQWNVPVAYSAAFGPLVKGSASISATLGGSAVVGGKLTASVGGLPSSGTNTVSYQWQSSKDGKSWTNSTTGNTKALSTGDLGLHYRCHVSATNPYYTIASGYTAASAAIGKGTVNASVHVSGTKSVGSKLTANVSGLPGTGTNTVAYKWQWSKDGSTGWTDSSYTDAKASSIVMHAEDVGYYYRCVITVSGNAYYNVNGATSAAYGPIGKGSHAAPTVSISGTKAYGSTLTANVSGQPGGTTSTTYQWQRNSGTNGSWVNISNATGKTYVLAGSDMNHSLRVLANTSNTYYNVSQGVSAAYGTIGKASKTISASVGGTKNNTSRLTVSVSGLPTVGTNTVSYQWQWSKDGSTGWTNSTYSDGKSNAIQMKEADVAYYYRCVVSVSGNAYYNVTGATTAAYGPMAKSSHGAPTVSVSGSKTYGSTLTANVSGQPSGTTATSYQWQRASSATGTWSNISNATGKTYKLGTGDMNQYLRVLVGTTSTYYTVAQGVSSAYGTIGKATASISATVSGSKVIESAITANVTGLPSVGTNTVAYQWQYSNDNKTWTSSTQSDAKTKTITPNHTWAGVYARCVISVSGNAYYNINGYTLNVGQIGKGTKTVSISLTGNAAVGGSLKANVSGLPSNGTNTVVYQWQYSSDNKTWTNSTAGDAKTATHALNYKEAYNLYWRCTMSVSGNQYYNVHDATSASQHCGKGTASITASISGSTVIGGKLTCSVRGLPSIGTNSVSYKWQYSADGKTWTDSSNSGAKTNSISLPPDWTLGKRFRCVVTATNAVYNNMSATSAATAAIGKGTATASVSVSGSKVYGATLTANPSQPTGTTGTSYQWQRNTGTNGAWVNISNATGKTYKLGTADVGHSVRVLVNTANTYYNVSQCASAAAAIGKASTTATATISGTKAVGSKLTVSVGGLPSVGTNTIAYRWQYSSDNKTWTDSNSTGAKSNAITTDTTWLNKYARCVVTVSGNAYYNVNGATSAAYGPIGKSSHSAPSVSISGSKVYGATLTANVSGQPSGTTSTTYQWQRASSASGFYLNISGATGKTYKLGTGDMNHYLRVLVNTANTYYNVSQGVSAGYGSIGKASHAAPSVSVSGDKSVGATLTASVSGQPNGTTSTTYQWQRASSASGSYSNISGATGKTYKTVDADANKYVRVLVNTANTYYTVSQGVSAGYGAIIITGGEANLDYTEDEQAILKCTYNTALTITPVYQWYRNGQPIKNATKNTYKLTEADCGKNIECHVSDSNQELKGYLSDNKNIPVLKTVNLDANGGKFSDGSTKHTIKYIQESELVIKYSHTDNIDDEGNATGTYKANLSTNDVVTIPGATKLTIDVWHATGVKLHDWLAIYPKGITPSSLNYLKATISNGKLGGSFATEKDSATHDTFEVNDDTAQFYFKSNGISEYYGYYAVVKGNCQINKIISGSNETSTPNDTNYSFDRWNTSIDGKGDEIDNIFETKDNTTLYAKYKDMRSAFAVYCANDKSLNFYKRMNIPSVGDTFNGRAVTAVYTGIEKNSYNNNGIPWKQYTDDILTSTIVDDNITPISTAYWFFTCQNLTSVNNLNKLNTSKVTAMTCMFDDAYRLTSVGDLSGWDTSSVTNMREMFASDFELTSVGDLSGWDTSSVTDMSSIFHGCGELVSIGNISGWNTSRVKDMNSMFHGCSSLTSLDLSGWNTSGVTNMGYMFFYCSSLTSLNLSGWNTSNVTNMISMFNHCSKLSLNCSNWNVSKVTKNNDFNTNAPGVIAPAWPSSDEIVDEDPIAPQSNELLEENQSKENTKQEKPNNVLTEQNSQTNNAIDNSNNLNNTSDTDNQTGDINTKSENVYEYHLAA